MQPPNPKVDGFLRKNKQWLHLLTPLRAILLDSPLLEDVKWRIPCYTFQNNNVALLATLKDCCTLGFMKGALLKDPHALLEPPGPNTQSARVIRFTSPDQIAQQKAHLHAYILEAIEIEKSGLKVAFKKIDEHPVPEELTQQFALNPALKTAFHALTPGRQRAYLLHFSSAKQSATRTARILKYTPKILAGIGFHDE